MEGSLEVSLEVSRVLLGKTFSRSSATTRRSCWTEISLKTDNFLLEHQEAEHGIPCMIIPWARHSTLRGE